MIRISSSQFPACCGVGFVSRPKLYRMITFGEELVETFDMRRGKLLEPLTIRAVEAELGCLFEHTGDEQRTKEITCGDIVLSSTPDGRLGDEGLEVKAPRKLSAEPPKKYLPQLAGQMLVHDLSSVLYCELAERLAIWRVYRSDALEASVVDAVGLFTEFVR